MFTVEKLPAGHESKDVADTKEALLKTRGQVSRSNVEQALQMSATMYDESMGEDCLDAFLEAICQLRVAIEYKIGTSRKFPRCCVCPVLVLIVGVFLVPGLLPALSTDDFSTEWSKSLQ